MRSGIYQILNVVNRKCYVGSAKNLKQRKNAHFNTLRKNKHHAIKLQRAWNKYGEESFEFKILEYYEFNERASKEQYWIDKLDSYKNGYNSRKNAESPLGMKLSEEHKRKISMGCKGKTGKYWLGKQFSEEHKSNLRIAFAKRQKHPNTGRQFSEEHRKNIGISQKGKIRSEEARKKMSSKLMGNTRNLGKEGYWKDKNFSKEHKIKLGLNSKKNWSKDEAEERRKNQSELMKYLNWLRYHVN